MPKSLICDSILSMRSQNYDLVLAEETRKGLSVSKVITVMSSFYP